MNSLLINCFIFFMTEELPYMPTEIVNVIAHFTEGIAGLAFIQTSKTYYKALSQNKIEYFKQHQLDQINKNKTVVVDDKQYYGSPTGFYCNDCSCFLIKKDSIKKHYMGCHKNKPLICEHCDAPKPYHRVFDKTIKNKKCIFQMFSCHHCKKSYHHIEHDSDKCPEKDTFCNHCGKTVKLKYIPSHDCNYNCDQCRQKIDYQTRNNHYSSCPEQLEYCYYCHKKYKKNNSTSRGEHDQICKSKCDYCLKMIPNNQYRDHRINCTIECIKCKQMVHIKHRKIHKYDCLEASIDCELCGANYKPNNQVSTEKHNEYCRSVCFKCSKFYKYKHVCDPSIVRVYDHDADCFCFYKEYQY